MSTARECALPRDNFQIAERARDAALGGNRPIEGGLRRRIGGVAGVTQSAQHRGHAGDVGTGETHFRVVIESDRFVGMSRLERQRTINRALAGLLPERIHALAIVARAPGETR